MGKFNRDKFDRLFQRVQTATMREWVNYLGKDDAERRFLFQRFKDGFRRGVIPIEAPDPKNIYANHTLTRQVVKDFLKGEGIQPRKLFPPMKPGGQPNYDDLLQWLKANADGNTPAPELRRRAAKHFGVDRIPDSRGGWRDAWADLSKNKKLKLGYRAGTTSGK